MAKVGDTTQGWATIEVIPKQVIYGELFIKKSIMISNVWVGSMSDISIFPTQIKFEENHDYIFVLYPDTQIVKWTKSVLFDKMAVIQIKQMNGDGLHDSLSN